MTYFENRYLTLEEMKVNAVYIYEYFLWYGWTPNAICGMLGNMQTESTINPGIWENLTPDLNRGYGLVQWTPANKYFTWLFELDLQDTIDTQIYRIIYELEHGLQWIAVSEFNYMSFSEFSISTQTPAYLADVFIKSYERPANPNQPIRGEQADFWYEYLTGLSPTPQKDNNFVALMASGAVRNWF